MTIGLALVMLEIFIPSGGILGFLSAITVLGSIYVAFANGGAKTGFSFVGVAVVGIPIAIVLALKYLPDTPIGRRLLLGVPSEEEVLPEADPRHALRQLVGKFGKANSAMLPGGTVVIDGRSYEAVSESGAIDKGEPVEVVMVRTNRLVIRKVKEMPPQQTADDLLSQPVDSVGIESLDDPLA
jgi:membrane-bound ClpP family serine protease